MKILKPWRKSSSSVAGNCVEVAPLENGEIGVRNSRDPDGPALSFTQAEFTAWVEGAKNGEWDEI